MIERSVQHGVGTPLVTKITGFPGYGRVVGCHIGWLHAKLNKYNTEYWDILFPNWQKKLVYYLLFEEPRKTCSKDDLRRMYVMYNEAAIEDMFQKMPVTDVIAYCEDDLEPYDDN